MIEPSEPAASYIDARRLVKGEKLETTVAGVSAGIIFLDLNAKTEGILDAAEFTSEDGTLSVKEGDRIAVYFLGESPDGLKFTAKFSAESADAEVLGSAWKNHIPVEGQVEREIKGGFEIRVGKERAFCPYSQTGMRASRGAENGGMPAGKKMIFLITEFRAGGKSIVVSHRAWLEEEEKKRRHELLSALKKGMRVKGTVASIHPFGIFADIGGFQALVPISEISRKRLSGEEEIRALHPEGSEIEAVVLNSDMEREKASLSIKALEKDPWQGVQERYPAGSKVSGRISRVADFGIFVSLEEGVEGLVHISELEKAGLVQGERTNLKKAFKTGDTFHCEILSANEAARRIALAPAESKEQSEAAAQYLGSAADGETYSPFAALLQKKKQA